jgi:hypothetical protein
MSVQLRGNGKTVRGMVLLPLTWLVTCALLLLTFLSLSASAHFSIAVWTIVALNFTVLFFMLRLEPGTSVACRILVSGVLAVIAPGVATALLILVAMFMFGMPMPD